jgi:epoxyqueuosine reductase
VVLEPYSTQPLGEKLRFARYLRQGDYHSELKTTLEKFVDECQQVMPGLKAKVCVDTSAVLERTWAALCGLGWIGKNTLLIHPQLGSYHFIGLVIFDQQTGAGPLLHKNYCGNCDRCLKACPTQAFVAPSLLDARKCISYLTLEYRGEIAPRVQTAPWVAGCDVCQEVCPFNLKRTESETGLLEVRPTDATVIRTTNFNNDFDFTKDVDSLLELTEEQYRARTKNSSLSRVKYAAFRRNLARILKTTSSTEG